MLEMATSGVQGARDIGQVGVIVVQPGAQIAQTPAQGRWVPRGHRDQARARWQSAHRSGGRLGQQDMHVGAAETERTDGAHARAAAGFPGAQRGVDEERRGPEMQLRIFRLEVARREQSAVPQRQHDFQESGNAGRVCRVADIGLDRPDRAKSGPIGPSAECPGQALDFDRIAQFRAGPVRFDIGNRLRIDAGLGVDFDFQRRLRVWAGGGDTVGLAVLVDGGGQNNGLDMIAVGQRLGVGFQHDDAGAFARNETIRVGIESLAGADGGQHAGLGGGGVETHCRGQEDSAGQCHVAVAVQQAAAGKMNGGKRGRTRGIHRHARSLEVQHIGDTPRQDRRGIAHEGEGFRHNAEIRHAMRIVAAIGSDEDAAAPPVEFSFRVAGVFQRPPCLGEEHAVLRIGEFGFLAGHAEKQRIEVGGVLEEPTPAEIGGLRADTVRQGRGVGGPAIGGDFGDAAAAFGQHGVEGGDVRAIRETTGNADDGDALVFRGGGGFAVRARCVTRCIHRTL